MGRRTTLVGITVSILVASVGISNLAYAHVDVCAGTDNGVPFTEIWAAICDLQIQIDNFEKTHNNQLVNVGIKRVQLNDVACSTANDPTTYPIPVGWCPSSGSNKYLITDPALTDKSIVSISIFPPQGTNNISIPCRVDSINYIEGPSSGFLVACDSTPPPNTRLNYIVFFDYSPMQVGSVNTPPVGTTNNPSTDSNNHHDYDKKSKSHDDDRK